MDHVASVLRDTVRGNGKVKFAEVRGIRGGMRGDFLEEMILELHLKGVAR